MKGLINKVFNFTYKFILVFSIISFLIALIGSMFFYVNRSNNYFNPILLITGSIIYLFIILRLYKWVIKLDDKKKKIISICLLVLQFIMLFVSIRFIRSIPQVDLLHILTGINSLNNNGVLINSDYFSVYPNNRFLLLILYGINKISISNSELLYYLLSSLCITIMSLFTYKTVKEITNINKALISLFICVFSPIFYLYVSYYYTDILMLPFASILMYLIVKNNKTEDLKKNIGYGILIGIFAIIGYKIRAVAIFLLIAYFVYLILSKKIKNLFICFLPILVGLILTNFCIKTIENNFYTDIDSTKEFPLTHWIMMGVNKEHDGYYNQSDYNLSASKDNVNDRISLNIDEIKKRLKNNGLVGNISLVANKIIVVWGKGDYSYQKYLDLSQVYNQSYDYLIKDKNVVINYILQISKIGILFLVIVSLINLLKENKKSIMAIALFGSIVFYIIWEVCPRYGLSFLPWLIIISSLSYDTLEITLKKIDKNRIIKYSILIITLIMFLLGFNKYTKLDYKDTLISKDTSKKIMYVDLNRDNEIDQSIILNRKFNEIKLRFKYIKGNLDTYTLKLLDESRKIVYESNFNINDLKNDKYTIFKLDEEMNAGLYYINLTTDSVNSIDAAISYKEHFDFYPSGSLVINEKEYNGDLMFEIISNKKRGIYTYGGYITLAILTILVEYIVLFRKKDQE